MGALDANDFRSMPAQKARSPTAVSTTTRTARSAAAFVKAVPSPSNVERSSAFLRSGLSIVITCRPGVIDMDRHALTPRMQ